MTTRTTRAALLCCSLLLTHHADAGLLDSPPPSFDGMQGQVIFRMGPIYYVPGQVDTVITCTNFDTTAVQLALELFDRNDSAAGMVARASLTVNRSVTFVTSADMSREDVVVIGNLPPLDVGKARVSATTAKISCTAHHRIRTADGAIQENPLGLIKKVARPPNP